MWCAMAGQQQDIDGYRGDGGHGYGPPRSHFKPVRGNNDGVVVAEVIEERHVEKLAAAAQVTEGQSPALTQRAPVNGLGAPLHSFVQQLAFAVVYVEDDVSGVGHVGSYYTPRIASESCKRTNHIKSDAERHAWDCQARLWRFANQCRLAARR